MTIKEIRIFENQFGKLIEKTGPQPTLLVDKNDYDDLSSRLTAATLRIAELEFKIEELQKEKKNEQSAI